MKLLMHLSRLREKLKNSFLNPLHSRTFLAEEREHTERKGVEEKFRAHSPIRVGLKIVLAITAIEFVIMLALYSFGAETSMPQYLFALIDTLALSIAASVMIVYWVVNPMNRYYQERLQNAEMLHRKEEHHKVVVESIFKFIPEGVLVLTESLNLLKHNKAFEEIVQKYAPLLGYAEQELTENIVEQCRTKIEHGDSKEIYISSKDQSRTDLSQSDTLILEFNTARMFLAEEEEEEEEEARIVVSLLDITERKRAETRLKNSEQRYRNIIQTSMDGFWIADTEGRILDVNAAYCQLIGYEREELLNMSVPDVEEKETPEMTAQHIQKVMTKGYDRFETRHRRKDGQLLDIEVSVVYQLDNEDGKFFIFLRDITERKRAEEEINMLAHSLRSVNECVSITDMEDNLIFVNQSFLNTYGYTEEELIGKQISMVRSPNNPLEVVREILPATLRGGWKGELLNRKKDGTEFPIFLSSTIIHDKEKKPLALIGVATDITERRRAEKEIISQKNRFAQLFENSPIAIALLDDQDKVVVINESFSALFGYFLEEIKGKFLNDLIVPPELKEEAETYSDQTLAGSQINKESYRKKKDGTLVYVQIVGIPVILNDMTVSIYGMYVDLTQRKNAEDKMRMAKELAEESNKLKSEFLAQMSHEVRTPINIIMGNVDYLNQSFSEKMDSDVRDCFDGIDLASKRIIRTVDLVLNVADLQTSGYEPQFVKVDLDSEVLNKLYKEHQQSAHQKGLELIYKCEVKESKVFADEYSITQIFANLIDNAINYTKKGKVEILLGKNRAGNIMVEVKDTGIGMSKEFLPRMFEPFVQEDHGYTRSYDGSGLGLALVKKYCDINNAIIEVESEKNVGSTFRVVFNKI